MFFQSIRVFLLVVALCLLSIGGAVANDMMSTASTPSKHSTVSTQILPLTPLLVPLPKIPCSTGSIPVTICGQNMNLSGLQGKQIFIGDTSAMTFTMPPPFRPDNFTVYCGGNPNFPTITADVGSVTCKYQPCKASSVSVCGREFPISAETEVGDSVVMTVNDAADMPPSDGSTRPSLPSFKAQCVASSKNTTYQVNDNSVSCNSFSCPTAEVKVCDTNIKIPGGSAMGEVLHLVMPEPFVADPYTVQCLGTNGLAPVYQVIDSHALGCQRR